MSIRRFLVPSLSLIVLACASLTAEAQSGPQGGQAGAAQKLTAERVATMLNSTVNTAADGSKSVRALIKKDDWQFEVVIVFLPDGKIWDMYSPLGAPGQNYTKAQLDGMQQKNKDWKADLKFFWTNPQDNRLYLADVNYLTTNTEEQFTQSLNNFLATIRNTHDLWKVG